jgi:TRAP-type C4-dicarboxylate transport system substrate-binding protein
MLWMPSAFAKIIKVGTVIPQGTTYSKELVKLGEAVQKSTKDRVKMRFYWGGVAGEEPDIMRKVRVGQMDGGVFTAKTLSDVYSDLRLLEVPYSFESRAQSQKALALLEPKITEGLEKAGLIQLGVYELGEVYVVSSKEVKNPSMLTGKKLWLFQGDTLAESFSKSLGMVGVPLPLSDVLAGLSTGMVDTTYGPAIAIVGLQWHTKTRFLVDNPFGYHFQGFVLEKAVFNSFSIEDQAVIKKLAVEFAGKISDGNYVDAKLAKDAIIKSGVKPVSWSPAEMVALRAKGEAVLKTLSGKLFSKDALDLLGKVRGK